MITLNLIKFAFKKDDTPKYIILNDQHYDNYCIGDSGQEAYGHFEYLGEVKIEKDTLREIAAWYNTNHCSPLL